MISCVCSTPRWQRRTHSGAGTAQHRSSWNRRSTQPQRSRPICGRSSGRRRINQQHSRSHSRVPPYPSRLHTPSRTRRLRALRLPSVGSAWSPAADLASVAWDKPRTSAGKGDDSVTPDSGFNSFAFTNVMYAPNRLLRLTIVVEQSANPANGSVLSTQDGVGADDADNLLLSPRNVLFTVTLEGYPFVSPHNLLALNVSHLASRGDAVPNLDFTQLSAWDLSGQGGIGASAVNRPLNLRRRCAVSSVDRHPLPLSPVPCVCSILCA